MSEERIHPLDDFWQLVGEEGLDPGLVAEFQRMGEDRPWQPLGRVLIDLGHLTFSQATAVLRIQADEPQTRFGDLAVREGFCSLGQVEEALAHQRANHPGPLELMLRDERLESTALVDMLAAYVRHLEACVYDLRVRCGEDPVAAATQSESCSPEGE